MAGFAGTGVGYFYVAEGEGSLLLYVLPVTRGWLARRKAATCLVFSLPTMAIIATLGYVFGEPSIAVAGIIIFLLGAIGSSLVFSFLAARGLPSTPAVWTNETLREGYVGVQFIGLLIVVGLFLVSAFPVFVSEAQGFHSSLLMALLASEAFFLVGLATLKLKDEPL
jgi:multisubunit Na+/H+ antiporter MnhF subunit